MVMDLATVKDHGKALSAWAHIATVGADGNPDVVPVVPAWEGDVLWAFTGANSVKVRNIRANPNVALHWQVGESGDGLEVWGVATVHDDVETKRRLWDGVFDYNLADFAPGGPENSPDTVFVAIQPQRALFLKNYGMAGIDRWSAT
jgi:PPOX class probable F420-dependent enzyme